MGRAGDPGALIRIHAAAKINLYLKILGRRSDGLHDIVTAVQSISLDDTLVLEARDEGIGLEVDDPGIPDGPENLAWKAAAALPLPAIPPRGVHISLRKRIPAGAGLGGGSSDAAAVLIGLRRLWDLHLSDRELEGLGATLGSDVPYFLQGGTALLEGTGTVVHPLGDRLGYEVLIVFPGTPLATRDVYAAATAPLTSAPNLSSMKCFKPVQQDDLPGEVEAWVRAGNDLEAAARSLCPSIGVIKEHLLKAGATAASMTGSGSAVFGIFRDKVAIGRALATARAAGFAARRCVPLGREDYRRRAGFL